MTLLKSLINQWQTWRRQPQSAQVWQLASTWALVLALSLVPLQAFHNAWRWHAMVDSFIVYFDRANYFFTHGNLTELPFNEYQPGAIFYFVALSPIFWWSSAREVFVNTVILSNVAMLAAYGWWLRRWRGPIAALVLAGVIAAAGPISLFRFEVFCHLWVVAALWCWWKRWPWWTGFLLGVAIITKVYPVFWLPFLAWWQPVGAKPQLRWSWALQVGVGTALGVVAVLAAYLLLFRVSATQVETQLLIHAGKPIHFESVIGALTMLKTSWLEGRAPAPLGSLIHGIAPEEFGAMGGVMNYLWLPIAAAIYWSARRLHRVSLSYLVSTLVWFLAAFLTLSTQLGPQYMLWFSLLVPLVTWPRAAAGQLALVRALGWLAVTLLLTQFVFPLWYTELLNYFDDGLVTLPVVVLWLRSGGLILFTWSWWRWQRQLDPSKDES